jgi:hypothetical protein
MAQGNITVSWQPPVALADGSPIPSGDKVSLYVVEIAVLDTSGIAGAYTKLSLANPTDTQVSASNLPPGNYTVRVTAYDNQSPSLAGVQSSARFLVPVPVLAPLGPVQNIQVQVS